jgi:hypothetical protein
LAALKLSLVAALSAVGLGGPLSLYLDVALLLLLLSDAGAVVLILSSCSLD